MNAPTHPNQWIRRRPVRAVVGLAALSVLGLASCQDPLLTAADQRSQYDRYDRVRNEFAPQYLEDEYGRREPNLRGRLAPRQ